jgi:hydrogen peroxide-dependent heme synthase
MSSALTPIAHPPETLEGWYALHQIYTCDPNRDDTTSVESADGAAGELSRMLGSVQDGWSVVVRLIGSMADLMVIHFRPTLDGIGEAQKLVSSLQVSDLLSLDYAFLSVTEAGLYHLTAKLAQEAAARGGAVGDETYLTTIRDRAAAERSTDHVRKRLYPPLPADMPYVCFYPMSKRRDAGQNWYTLSLDERSRLMQTHGMTGRRYAGRVQQVITGAIGFEAWEWGVTLFAKDPLDFKKLVTDMRFDEVSAKYAEFGEFFVGKRVG